MNKESIVCRQCGKEVEEARRCYAIPTCYACLPPPEPLPIAHNTNKLEILNRKLLSYFLSKKECDKYGIGKEDKKSKEKKNEN